jgi:uncharacterized membrane protein (DUF2068 family)
MPQTNRPDPALRAVALLELTKGALVVAAGLGLLSLLHRDVAHIAQQVVHTLHLNADARYPHIFLAAAANVNDMRIWSLAGLAALYASVRFAEAYGLWFGRRWGEWLGALGGAVYLPFELYELIHRASPVKAITFALNLVIVAYLGWRLAHRKTSTTA